MAIAVTTDLVALHDGETATGWTTDDAVTAYSGWQIAGSYCLGLQASSGTIYAYRTITSVDMRDKRAYQWFQMWGNPQTLANGGFRMIFGDGTNRIAYYVGGSDYMGFQRGAWSCFMLDCEYLHNTASGTGGYPGYTALAGSESSLDWSAITVYGVQFNMVNKAVGTVDNVYFDIGRRGTKLTVGGTDGTFSGLVDDDITNAYGIIRRLASGVYGVQGGLEFGNSATASSSFADTNKTVVYEDRTTYGNTYFFNTIGNSTGTNTFTLGTLSGTSGISGCTIASAGSSVVTTNLSNANVDTMKLYGCNLQSLGAVTLPAASATKEVFNCSFINCKQVSPSSCEIRNCNFINTSDADASLLWGTSADVEDSNFIANTTGAGIEHATVDESDYNNLSFSGNTYDILYSASASSGELVINALEGSNPTTYEIENATGNSVSIVMSPVTTEITVKDLSTGSVIENAKVLVWVTNDDNYFYQASVSIAGSGTTATVTHNSHGLATGDFVIIEGVTNDDDYNGVYEVTVSDTNTYTYTATETLGSTPATGTVTSTFALIYDDTNASGIANDIRVLSANQAIAGWVRKASSSPYYAQGVISGTVDSDSGFSATVQLARDE